MSRILLNPLLRHLHPRASGMIAFKGGSSTNITNTGLGDEQYTNLSGNQENIAKTLDDYILESGVSYEAISGKLGELGLNINDVQKIANEGFTGLQEGMGTLEAANQGRYDLLGQQAAQQTTDINQNVNTGIGNIQGDLSTGFGGVDSRFDTVDAANEDLQYSVDTGFGAQATAFTDLDTLVNARFDTASEQADKASEQADKAFGTVGDTLGEMNTGIMSGQEAVQQNVLAGQNTLGGTLDTLGTNQDAYYKGLSDAQGRIEGKQDLATSAFDSYVERYSDDTTLANQKRLDIQDQVVNGADLIRKDIGTASNFTNDRIADVGDTSVRNQEALGTAVEGFADANNQGQVNLADSISGFGNANNQGQVNLADSISGFADANNQGQVNLADSISGFRDETGQSFATQLNSIAAASLNIAGLDKGMTRNFAQMADAFDDNGQLVQNSINKDGSITRRMVDAQGNLQLGRFSNAGEFLGEDLINVQETVLQMQGVQQNGFMAP